MHTDISLFCWKLHRGLKAEKVHLCITKPPCCCRFHLWFALTPHLSFSLTLCKCVSVTAVGVLVESLQNGVPSRGPFVCCFDYEQAISPRGWLASTLGLQKVRGCIFVCVRECIHKCRESERRWDSFFLSFVSVHLDSSVLMKILSLCLGLECLLYFFHFIYFAIILHPTLT